MILALRSFDASLALLTTRTIDTEVKGLGYASDRRLSHYRKSLSYSLLHFTMSSVWALAISRRITRLVIPRRTDGSLD